jgi:hypothetical protein
MSNDALEVVVDVDRALADEVQELLTRAGADVEGSATRGYDGAQTASWLVIATTAITAAPAMLAELREFLGRNKARSISVGELTIENPSPQDVDRAWELVQSRSPE